MININLRKIENEVTHAYSVHIYPTTRAELKAISDATGISMQNIVRSAINDFIDKYKEQ